jgi:PAS domain S-box-containing protein
MTSQHVLLVGVSDADAARIDEVLRAARLRLTVTRLADADATAAALTSLRPIRCIIVAPSSANASAREWRRMLERAELDVPLLGLGDLAQEATIVRWLTEGGTDWLFRPHLVGLPAVLARLEREQAEALAHETMERRWREGTAELVRLARDPAFQGSDLPTVFARINEAAVRTLQVSRSSVWLLDCAAKVVTCTDRFEARTQQHDAGRHLKLDAQAQVWFERLQEHHSSVLNATGGHPHGSFLALASDADPPTAGIAVALRSRGTLAGVLCVEHVGPQRRWHAGEESFTQALADLASLALESSERLRAEEALRESQRRFQDLFQYSNDAIVLYRVSETGRVECEDINPAAEKLSGLKRETTVGRTADEVLQGPAVKLFETRWNQAIRAKSAVLYEQEYPLPAGRRWVSTAMVPFVDDAGQVRRLAAYSRDITQMREGELLQRSLEAQLAESQKNEALARLASHIAHDVNNLLSVIVAHTQRVQGLGGKVTEAAQAILEATARGRELTQQILTFGRRRPPERKPLELGPLVRETLRLLEPTAKDITVREVVAPRVPKVLGDAGQLYQVLTNLSTNALHAMGGGPGTLTISLEPVDLDFAFAARHPPLQAGRWIRLSVSDTGLGMDETTARRVFEPFFSTREDGTGTGLGLAVVQSIVQGHDGAVLVESDPEKGTTFHVYLPAVQEDLSRPGNGQHLMLVDDHPGMARVSARLLETLGYRTTVFDDPREALAAFRAAPTGFDAVLTDLSMPQMSGEDFTRELRELRPEVPVIVSSGMASELDEEARQRMRIDAVLVKPWRLEEAVAALQRVLG